MFNCCLQQVLTMQRLTPSVKLLLCTGFSQWMVPATSVLDAHRTAGQDAGRVPRSPLVSFSSTTAVWDVRGAWERTFPCTAVLSPSHIHPAAHSVLWPSSRGALRSLSLNTENSLKTPKSCGLCLQWPEAALPEPPAGMELVQPLLTITAPFARPALAVPSSAMFD